MPSGGGPATVALVTGAGRGLGRHISIGLAQAGLAVGLVGRNRRLLEETAAACRAAGVGVVVAGADVRDRAAVENAVQSVESGCGPIDLLVNNAGVIDRDEVRFADADFEDFWSVVETNLRGPALVTHAVLAGMTRRRKGRIVNVNTGFGYRAGDAYTGYSVSKGALARFTAMIAHQYAGDGVIALDISPGLVHTDMTAGMPMWRDPGTDWHSPDAMVAFVRAAAEGRLDSLTGRFLHATRDDVDEVTERAAQISAADARVVRLVPYGPTDPLG